MKAIEQTSLVLLSMSLLILVLIAAGFAFDSYTSRPPLYTPPPQNRDFSYTKSVTEATSLEGLKTVCTFWAEREDQTQRFVKAVHSQFNAFVHDVITTSVMLGLIFSAGLFYIYLTARRLRRMEHNAL
jgi:hypothetical protein